jgi:hypothetical protein
MDINRNEHGFSTDIKVVPNAEDGAHSMALTAATYLRVMARTTAPFKFITFCGMKDGKPTSFAAGQELLVGLSSDFTARGLDDADAKEIMQGIAHMLACDNCKKGLKEISGLDDVTFVSAIIRSPMTIRRTVMGADDEAAKAFLEKIKALPEDDTAARTELARQVATEEADALLVVAAEFAGDNIKAVHVVVTEGRDDHAVLLLEDGRAVELEDVTILPAPVMPTFEKHQVVSQITTLQ